MTMRQWWGTWWHFRWFAVWWWRYLLTGLKGWEHFKCRVRGHPNGVWWFTRADAMEPDMHCRDCGENLG